LSQPEFPSHELEKLPDAAEVSRFDLSDAFPYAPAHWGRVWLHVLLFLLTLLTTSAVGARMQSNFDRNLPSLNDRDWDALWIWVQHPAVLLNGLPFSLTLLTILLAHECGHYVACLYYGIDASLPFFLPAPTIYTGTLGAFIRIRSPIFSRRQLFDIGVAGPLAGFLFLLPAAGIGLALSKVIPGIADMGSIHYGTPPLLRLLERAVFPGAGVLDIYLHPVARAAWVGMFATAMNMLPAGQLDGGHIVYALFGKVHRWITIATVVALVIIGVVYGFYGWLFWAVLLFFFARRHPPIYDLSEPGMARWKLGLLAFVLFLLCFSAAPVNQ
jgi:membrane-associated protease RseP (regulator of RpoE activity)